MDPFKTETWAENVSVLDKIIRLTIQGSLALCLYISTVYLIRRFAHHVTGAWRHKFWFYCDRHVRGWTQGTISLQDLYKEKLRRMAVALGDPEVTKNTLHLQRKVEEIRDFMQMWTRDMCPILHQLDQKQHLFYWRELVAEWFMEKIYCTRLIRITLEYVIKQWIDEWTKNDDYLISIKEFKYEKLPCWNDYFKHQIDLETLKQTIKTLIRQQVSELKGTGIVQHITVPEDVQAKPKLRPRVPPPS